jgi:hypothetical protein
MCLKSRNTVCRLSRQCRSPLQSRRYVVNPWQQKHGRNATRCEHLYEANTRLQVLSGIRTTGYRMRRQERSCTDTMHILGAGTHVSLPSTADAVEFGDTAFQPARTVANEKHGNSKKRQVTASVLQRDLRHGPHLPHGSEHHMTITQPSELATAIGCWPKVMQPAGCLLPRSNTPAHPKGWAWQARPQRRPPTPPTPFAHTCTCCLCLLLLLLLLLLLRR